MAAVTDNEKTEQDAPAAGESRVRGRRRRQSQSKSSKSKPRKSSPTRRVEPGWIHETLANAILTFVQNRASADTGGQIVLNVGEVETELPPAIADAEEGGQEPKELLARILARGLDKTPGFKKLEKRLEGKDAKAGVGSDITALLVQLYRLNEHTIKAVVSHTLNQAAAERAAKKASANGNGDATPEPEFPPPTSPQ